MMSTFLAEASKIDAGNTAWLLVSSALVMLMTPGLALFYGGMVQQKNVLSTFMHSFFALGIVTLAWVTLGYSLAFGGSNGGFIGNFDFAFLNGVGLEPKDGQTVPHLLFMAYQGMFAIITPALISGAYAERLKFSAYLVFTLLWSLLVYSPLAHWVWSSDGWLAKMGALDFAGGTVVHLSSGISALVAAIVIGRRVGYPNVKHQPHNLTMTLLGAGLLWFGWFGFNGGSALAADGLGSLAFVNTHIAAAMGALGWGIVEYLRIKKVTALGAASGLVAGLVGITPAAGFVSPMGALAIGLLTGLVCYGGVLLKHRFKYDDSLDAFGVHGIGGILGAVLTGVLASSVWGGKTGLLEGNTGVFVAQLVGVGAAAAFSIVMTWLLLKGIDLVIGLRPTTDDEREGLDTNLHGESGYSLGNSASGHQVPHEHARSSEPAPEPVVRTAAT